MKREKLLQREKSSLVLVEDSFLRFKKLLLAIFEAVICLTFVLPD